MLVIAIKARRRPVFSSHWLTDWRPHGRYRIRHRRRRCGGAGGGEADEGGGAVRHRARGADRHRRAGLDDDRMASASPSTSAAPGFMRRPQPLLPRGAGGRLDVARPRHGRSTISTSARPQGARRSWRPCSPPMPTSRRCSSGHKGEHDTLEGLIHAGHGRRACATFAGPMDFGADFDEISRRRFRLRRRTSTRTTSPWKASARLFAAGAGMCR